MTDKKTASVIIIEDDAHTRSHLEKAIAQHAHLTLIGSAESCASSRKLLQQAPDIALVDLELPDGSGIDLIQEYKSKFDTTEFMVMTVFGDMQHIIPALEAGASGYLLKDMPFEEIGDMITLLLDGGSPISPIIARKLLQYYVSPSQTLKTPFTKREHEVLKLMSKGFNHHETADLLKITHNTVLTHVKRIYTKLSVNSRSQAVYEASQQGFIRL